MQIFGKQINPPAPVKNAGKAVLGVAGVASNPVNAVVSKLTGGRVGYDPTPGFSATNVVKTQLSKPSSGSGSGGGNNKQSDPGTGNTALQGGYSGYGYGSGSGTPDYSGIFRGQIMDKWRTLQSVFDGLFGQIDRSYADKAAQVNKQYDTQTEDLNTTYKDTLNNTAMAYAGRGLGNSSYLGSGLDQNTNTYKQNLNLIDQNRTNSNAALGEALTQAKSSINAQRGQYQYAVNNLGNYDENTLNQLNSQLAGDLSQAQSSAANYLTRSEYADRLNAVTPVANNGSQQLQAQLANLINSSAPSFAKKQIAQGLIRRATQDPNQQSYWNNYYDSLLNGQG